MQQDRYIRVNEEGELEIQLNKDSLQVQPALTAEDVERAQFRMEELGREIADLKNQRRALDKRIELREDLVALYQAVCARCGGPRDQCDLPFGCKTFSQSPLH